MNGIIVFRNMLTIILIAVLALALVDQIIREAADAEENTVSNPNKAAIDGVSRSSTGSAFKSMVRMDGTPSIIIFTDELTGCQYLITAITGGITQRTDTIGNPICEEKE